MLSQRTVTGDTYDKNENPGDDFVIGSAGCNIGSENADILSNLESKVSHIEPSQRYMYRDSNHVFNGGCCNQDIPCIECTISIQKHIDCTVLCQVTL